MAVAGRSRNPGPMRNALVLVAVAACSSSHPSNGDKPIGPDTSPTAVADAGTPVVPPTTGIPAPGAEPYASGTRIKARYLVGEDGSRQFNGWLDTTTQVACAFQTAADGQLRCLPTSYIGPNFDTFKDSACTTPLAVAAKGCSVPNYVGISLTSTSVCSGAPIGLRILNRGDLYTGQIYEPLGQPSTCTAIDAAYGNNLRTSYDFYASGTELQPSTFAAATEQHD